MYRNFGFSGRLRAPDPKFTGKENIGFGFYLAPVNCVFPALHLCQFLNLFLS
jgi:hypothetical protein